MEKRANERSKEKMARLEAEAELKRKEEHKKLLQKIEAGEGKNFHSFAGIETLTCKHKYKKWLS